MLLRLGAGGCVCARRGEERPDEAVGNAGNMLEDVLSRTNSKLLAIG